MAYIETSRGTPSVLAERGTNIVFVDANGNQLFTVAHPGYVAFSGALPAGTNNIGKVDINSLPVLPAGDNNIGNVDIASMPSVSLEGSIPEYQWLSTDTPPALGLTDRAFGVEINTTTHTMTVKYWTGSAWQEVA